LSQAQIEFEVFPNQLEIDPESKKIPDIGISVAMRIMTHFERRGFNIELFDIFHPRLD
jgi:hypothetical protein